MPNEWVLTGMLLVQGEVYKNNHYVYVRGEKTPKRPHEENDKDFWVAKILQVRAANAQNVYALVSWMYWREELPPPATRTGDMVFSNSGQRKYHGNYELIASNYMEVLDVLSFAGKADVFHWEEEDDQLQSKLYWRQTLCRETKELSVSLIDSLWSPNILTKHSVLENTASAKAISTPK